MSRRGRKRRRPTRQRGKRRCRLARAALLTALTLAFLSWLPVLALRWLPPPTSAVMLAAQRAGGPDFKLRYQWVPHAALGPWLPLAMVAGEDQKFPQHHGFDAAAIRAALRDAGDGARLRGASTISQQTAKNLFLWNGRSFVRKGLEAWFTALIELTWPKARILEVYANIAEFGDGIYGGGAAARQFFGKPAAALTPREAALLAATLPNPRRLHADRPSAYVRQRATWIETQMHQLGGPAYLDWKRR